MLGLFEKWFRKAPDATETLPSAAISFTDRDDGPKARAQATGEPDAASEHATFCATFEHQPGQNFLSFLEAEGVTRMIEWLSPENPEPEPKAFIRLMLEMQRRSEPFWDQPGLSLFVWGRASDGGGPTQFSQDALSVLAQILKKPIKVYYNAPSGTLIVKQYDA